MYDILYALYHTLRVVHANAPSAKCSQAPLSLSLCSGSREPARGRGRARPPPTTTHTHPPPSPALFLSPPLPPLPPLPPALSAPVLRADWAAPFPAT